ncbi:MAG: hypothetical protein IJY25_04910 [Bacilli bacterium]|nr:hypothetical protein [Bacilli bacterium]
MINIKIEEIIAYILCDNHILKKYKLQKIKKYLQLVDINEIKTISERKFEIEKIRDKQSIPNKLRNDIDIFVNTMESKISKEKLQNLFSNIKWVKIVLAKKLFYSQDLGYYNPVKNKIKLFKKSLIYHELLHLSTNDIEINDSSNGFLYELDDTIIGEAINEGYTELLVGRYFKEKQELVKKELKEEIYFYEKRFAYGLERIVGQEKMEKFYFDADLFSLINELKKYYSTEEVINFLVKIDFILRYRNRAFVGNEELKIITSTLEYVIYFLIKGYCLKLFNENNSVEKNTELIINYLEYINEPIEFRAGRITSIDINKIKEVIKNYLGDNINLDISKSNENVL